MRRELGDEALIDARRRRDRPRRRAAADLDRLPPPHRPQPAQPGDRPVSERSAELGRRAPRRDGVAGDPLPLDRVPRGRRVPGGRRPRTSTGPVGSLTADDVVVSGGRRLPVPPYEVAFGGRHRHRPLPRARRPLAVHGRADRRRRARRCTRSSPPPSSASRSTARSATAASRRPRRAAPPAQPPAVDLLTKDFNGFVTLLADWVKVRNPHVADLSGASFERVLLDLLAWAGDMLSYYQDRVANEAFVETAGQRFSLRQHAVLLGSRLDDGHAPTTRALVRRRPRRASCPRGCRCGCATSPDEVPVTLHRRGAHARAGRERRAAGCGSPPSPAPTTPSCPPARPSCCSGATTSQLQAGDRLAFVQGSFAQVVTLAEAPRPARGARLGGGSRATTFDPRHRPAGRGHAAALERAAGASRCGRGADAAARAARQPRRRASTGRRAARVDARRPRAAARSRSGSRAARASSTRRSAGDGLPPARAARARVAGRPRRRRRRRQRARRAARRSRATTWTRVEHLHASRSYDLHYTAEADEEGAVWLRFGDGVNGREVALETPDEPEARDRAALPRRRPGRGQRRARHARRDRPRRSPARDEEVALDALGAVAVTNVVPATRRPRAAHARAHEGGAAVVAAPRAAAAGGRARGLRRRRDGGPGRRPRDRARRRRPVQHGASCSSIPRARTTWTRACAARVYEHVDALRMTGREHVVLAAEYVPLEVELLVCAAARLRAATSSATACSPSCGPGSGERPGWFHPDRLSFGDAVRLGDLLAFVQGDRGRALGHGDRASARSATPRDPPCGTSSCSAARRSRAWTPTPTSPRTARSRCVVVGLDQATRAPAAATASGASPGRCGMPSARRSCASARVGGVRPDGSSWRMSIEEVDRGDRARRALLRRGAARRSRST